MNIISEQQIENRAYWINEISRLSGDFGVDAERVEAELSQEISENGIAALLGHLRLCGAIPEGYRHDSSEEKLYSKYTDVVIHEAFKAMGFTSLVLKERADVADVECVTEKYSFVADAKAFRLSRTAKNQKDFKVQAMDNWKHGKPFATVVCPAYQLPSRTSQIYQQAATRSVLVSTYTHLTVGIRYAELAGQERAIDLLHKVFKTVETLNPSKNAIAYWQAINTAILDFDKILSELWREEKIALTESIGISKQEALQFLARERERIMRLSRDEAIKEVLKSRKIDNRVKAINKVADNGILNSR
ncbi:HindIII family type II restriction endonuclease [Candidatus Leptofilum sp.]|uniref:HindIII family type II restriction endonuclease n=1 Tax=Candidatus Leptofilum sp. TaxID=3241576 RepID=UPI003B5BC7E0